MTTTEPERLRTIRLGASLIVPLPSGISGRAALVFAAIGGRLEENTSGRLGRDEVSTYSLPPLPVRAPLPFRIKRREIRRVPVVGSALRRCTLMNHDTLLVEAWIRVTQTQPVVQRLSDEDWADLVAAPGTGIAVGAWRSPEHDIAEAYAQMGTMDASQAAALQLPSAVSAVGARVQDSLRQYDRGSAGPTTSVIVSWAEWPGAPMGLRQHQIGSRLDLWLQMALDEDGRADSVAASWAYFEWLAAELRARYTNHERRLMQLMRQLPVNADDLRAITLEIHSTMSLHDGAGLRDHRPRLPTPAPDADRVIGEIDELSSRVRWLHDGLRSLVGH